MKIIVLSGAIVIRLESSMIQQLLPMLHIQDTGACRVMADEHIIAFVVVDGCISVHDLSHNVSTGQGESRAEENSQISLEPAEARHEFVDSSQVEPFDYGRFIKQSEDVRFRIFDVGNWPEGEVFIKQAFDNCVSFAKGYVHLDAALAVPDVVRLLFGYFVHIAEQGWKVVICHMLEGEFPKLLIFVRVVFRVVSGMFVSSAVSQPDIVACVGKHKSWSFVLIVNDPSIRAVEQSMLQNDGFEAFLDERSLPLDPKDCEHISVFCYNVVGLDWIPEVFAVVGEIKFGLGMGAKDKCCEQGEGQQYFEGHKQYYGSYYQNSFNKNAKTTEPSNNLWLPYELFKVNRIRATFYSNSSYGQYQRHAIDILPHPTSKRIPSRDFNSQQYCK